jgi:hypothetical protein
LGDDGFQVFAKTADDFQGGSFCALSSDENAGIDDQSQMGGFHGRLWLAMPSSTSRSKIGIEDTEGSSRLHSGDDFGQGSGSSRRGFEDCLELGVAFDHKFVPDLNAVENDLDIFFLFTFREFEPEAECAVEV